MLNGRGVRRALGCALTALSMLASPAAAIDAPTDAGRIDRPTLPPIFGVLPQGATAVAPADSEPAPNAMERLRTTLRRLPLRPVRIGTTPRLPDDPEPGMGLVLRFRF